MPHDPGSSRHLDKKMKMVGLGRLVWYCQVCQKQCRDANSFKQHTLSESHARRITNIDDVRGTINDFSLEFQTAFLNLLRTGHQDKSVNANRFYQGYIADKHHTHLNSTKWSSLTEFVKHLGRESLCHVEEKDDGLFIAWIDRSPQAVRRQEALRRKEQLEVAGQAREEDIIKAQIERAQANRKDVPAAAPAADAAPLPAEPGKAISFQLTAAPKEGGANSASAPKKQANPFKVAKRNALKDAGKKKHTELKAATANAKS